MSAASFDCPGCGNSESYGRNGRRSPAAIGAVFVYEGMALIYTLCPECANARGKKLREILERVELTLLPAEGSA